jgi:two-component system cell cycle sensor histidine kinase/response regulator CckA
MERRTGAGRVLIVDDSDIVLDFGRIMLERAGFEVRGALDLAQLATALAAWAPDVVLADVNMPELSGPELIARIRTLLPARRTVPIVLVSGLEGAQLPPLAHRVGADAWFCKNDGLEQLPQTVRRLLAAPAVSA